MWLHLTFQQHCRFSFCFSRLWLQLRIHKQDAHNLHLYKKSQSDSYSLVLLMCLSLYMSLNWRLPAMVGKKKVLGTSCNCDVLICMNSVNAVHFSGKCQSTTFIHTAHVACSSELNAPLRIAFSKSVLLTINNTMYSYLCSFVLTKQWM